MKPITGMVRYNEQDDTIQYYDGDKWYTPSLLPKEEPPKSDLLDDLNYFLNKIETCMSVPAWYYNDLTIQPTKPVESLVINFVVKGESPAEAYDRAMKVVK